MENTFLKNKLTIEHIKPKSKGGDNDYFNLTLTCVKCNSRKGSIFPYYDYKGDVLKATPPKPFMKLVVLAVKNGNHFYSKILLF